MMVIVVMLLRALVNALHEDIVQLLSHRDLRVLQLGKRIHHHCIVEVFLDHALQKSEVVSRELTDALVKGVGNLLVWSHLTIYYLLDVAFTLCHVLAELG